MTLTRVAQQVLGSDLSVRFEAYDGSTAGPPEARAKIVVRSPDALRRIVTAPGELGLGRAYVSGDLDLEGDIFAALELRQRYPSAKLGVANLALLAREARL